MDHLVQFIANHWPLWVALGIILVVIFINEFISQKKRAKELTPSATVAMINDRNAVIFDLRDAAAYEAGHIIGAIHTSVDEFKETKMDKYKPKPLVLVCDRGLQSATCAAKLRQQGFMEPMVLAGGMAAWVAESLPVVKGKNKNKH